MKLILIDSTLLDVDVLTSSVASSNKYVLFNSFTDTYASLINSIKDAMNEVESIDSVCVLNHGSHAALHLILHLEQDQEKWFDFWSELVSLYHIQNIDLLGCNLYSDESWRAIMDQMETELSVNVRSSSNRTGNNVDEDWIMESDGIDVRPIYFNDTINTYVHSLYLEAWQRNDTQSVIYSNEAAFAALKSDGSVVTWGNSEDGGDLGVNRQGGDQSSGVKNIYHTRKAFAALKDDGSVVTWGHLSYGAYQSYPYNVSDKLISGVKTIYSTDKAFAALKSDGSVVTWGIPYQGGDSSSVSTYLTSGVNTIYSNHYAFAALKDDGSVVTWGTPSYGSDQSYPYNVSDKLISGVKTIYSTDKAFAALKSDGSVVTWGIPYQGGDSSSVSTYLTSGVNTIYSNHHGFAALKEDGSVVFWGWFTDLSSSVSSNLSSGVNTIFSTAYAFAALKEDGSVVTWGNYNYDSGRNSSSVDFNGGVKTIYSTNAAFAALKTDGSVVTWGNNDFGGNSSSVDFNGGVKTIYSTKAAFAALKTDGSVVTWGNNSLGGNSSSVDLSSDIITIYSTNEVFAALKSDGAIVTWGNNSYYDFIALQYGINISNSWLDPKPKNADSEEQILSVHKHLVNQDFQDWSFLNVDLTDADLTNADLTNADLTDADLTNADLTNADLTNADLTNANLSNVILTNVNLSGTNLSNTILTNVTSSGITGTPDNVPSPYVLSGGTFLIQITLSEITPISTPSNDVTPSYVFSTTASGTITSSIPFTSPTSAVAGSNTITFATLDDGTYENESIQVEAAGSTGTLTIPTFTISTATTTLQNISVNRSLSINYKLSFPTAANSTPASITYDHNGTNSIENNNIRGKIIVDVAGQHFNTPSELNPSAKFEIINDKVTENSVIHIICTNVTDTSGGDMSSNLNIAVYPYHVENGKFSFFFVFFNGNSLNTDTKLTFNYVIYN